MLASNVVRAYAQAVGSRKNRVGDKTLSRSRGGLSTTIQVLVDALGRPVDGLSQQADCQRAADLLRAAKAYEYERRSSGH
jgi:hypothetical protein